MRQNERSEVSLIGRFPFVMVLTTMILRGILFMLLNIPLIGPVIQEKSYQTLATLLSNEHLAIVEELPVYLNAGGGLLLIFLAVSMSLGIGLVLSPVESGITYILVKPLNRYYRNRKENKGTEQIQFFNSGLMLTPEYSKLLEWFFINTNQRSHWEWELFHFYISWSIFLNLAIFSCSSIYLLRSAIRVHEIILIAIGNLAFLIFALLRSRVMSNVHMLYVERSKSQREKDQNIAAQPRVEHDSATPEVEGGDSDKIDLSKQRR